MTISRNDASVEKRGPDRIYLEPPCAEYRGDGRQWCEDNVWPTDDVDDCPECQLGGVEYIRADLATLPSVEQIRAEAFEEAAKVAEERAVICKDAVQKIEAGELYRETAEMALATERCAMFEASHIARAIRAMKGNIDHCGIVEVNPDDFDVEKVKGNNDE